MTFEWKNAGDEVQQIGTLRAVRHKRTPQNIGTADAMVSLSAEGPDSTYDIVGCECGSIYGMENGRLEIARS